MSWEAINATAQLISSIAVVASLRYLAIQSHRSTHVTKLTAQDAAASAVRDVTKQFSENAELGRIGQIGFFFSNRRRHTRSYGDWSSDVCSSDLSLLVATLGVLATLGLGWAVARLLLPHSSWMTHLFLGGTLCATSVGITARVLRDLGQVQRTEAQIILGAAVIDDVIGLVVLAVV